MAVTSLTAHVLQRGTNGFEAFEIHADEAWAETFGFDETSGDHPANGLGAARHIVCSGLDCSPFKGLFG